MRSQRWLRLRGRTSLEIIAKIRKNFRLNHSVILLRLGIVILLDLLTIIILIHWHLYCIRLRYICLWCPVILVSASSLILLTILVLIIKIVTWLSWLPLLFILCKFKNLLNTHIGYLLSWHVTNIALKQLRWFWSILFKWLCYTILIGLIVVLLLL